MKNILSPCGITPVGRTLVMQCWTVIRKKILPAGPLSINFEGPQAILRAIGPRARLILTPAEVVNDIQRPICQIWSSNMSQLMYHEFSALLNVVWHNIPSFLFNIDCRS